MLTQLIDLLNKLDLDPTPQEIGDMLWLAEHLDAPTKSDTEYIIEPEIIHQVLSDNLSQAARAPSHSATEVSTSASQLTLTEEPHAKLYSSRSKDEEAIASETKGIDFRSPGVPALPGALELARALRPFKRTSLSRTHCIFDEKASIDAAANVGNPLPVLRPAPSRWLDVVLVVDESPSMVIWRSTIQEFQRLLERQGAFRNVQCWSLQYESENSEPRLQISSGNGQGLLERKASELIDPAGQRLILLVTDCISSAWDHTGIATLIKTWGNWGPVAIVQMLPKYLWHRTALGDMPKVHLRPRLSALPNAQLDVKWLFNEYDPDLQHWFRLEENQAAGVVVPVVTLEPQTLASWSAAVASGNSAWIAGFFFPTTPLPSEFEDEFDAKIGSDAEQIESQPDARLLVESFNKTASPMARQLARYLAAAPLTLPVMRLVQSVMLPDSLQVHLAEVFLSGLIECQTSENTNIDLDEVQYEFIEGVREELLATGRLSTTVEVLKAVSLYLGVRLGQPLDFQAWLAVPSETISYIIPKRAQHFAIITSKVLRQLGGKYLIWASQLDSILNLNNINFHTISTNVVNRQTEYQQVTQVVKSDALSMFAKANTTLPTISQVREAFKDWHTSNSAESAFATLYIYRQLQRELGRTSRHTANQLLLTALEQMRQRRMPEADFLQRRFLDDASIGQLAQHYSVAESTIYTMQRVALERATEAVRELEIQARAAQRERLWRRLGAPAYGELVGVQPHIEHLLGRLREVQPPWIVAIEGVGGIGKTALADALLRQIIEQDVYDEIGWVSAQQHRLNLGGAINTVPQPALTADSLVDALVQQLLPDFGYTATSRGETLLPRLRALLKQIPHLIVIDNLESLLDVESLLPTLQELANPTKFLLTSRDALYTTPSIYHFKVPELDEAHTLQLVRQEAQISNLPALATAPDSALQPIYATVGGNPLALRLIVGQTHIYTLASILDHLRKAQGKTAENLYTYIYRRAWDGLDALSQDLLLIMPLVNPGGDDVATIAAGGGLDADVVRQALDRLVTFNLVDVHGTVNERRYHIHGLTRAFLHKISRFVKLLVRGALVAQQRIEAEGLAIPISDEARERAQNVLSYTLKEATAWPAARDLLLTMAPKMEAAGYRQEWLAYLNDGLWQSQQQGDQAAQAALQFHCGYLYRLLSNYEQAYALLSASATHYAALGETAGQARALNQLAYLTWQQHRYEEAEHFAQAALQILDENSLEKAMSLSVLGLVANNRSRYAEAEKYHYEALRLRTEHNAHKEMAWSLQNLGFTAGEQGKYEVAIAYHARALTLLDKVYDPALRAIIQMNIGSAYYLQRDYSQALDSLNNAEQVLRRLSDRLNLAKLLTTKGLCYLAQHHWELAEQTFQASAHLFHELGDLSWYLNAYDGLGISYLEREQYEQALAIFEQIVAQLPQIEGTPAHKYLTATLAIQVAQAKAKQVKIGESVYRPTSNQE